MAREDGGSVSQLASLCKYPDMPCGTTKMDQDSSMLMKTCWRAELAGRHYGHSSSYCSSNGLLRNMMRNWLAPRKNPFSHLICFNKLQYLKKLWRQFATKVCTQILSLQHNHSYCPGSLLFASLLFDSVFVVFALSVERQSTSVQTFSNLLHFKQEKDTIVPHVGCLPHPSSEVKVFQGRQHAFTY